MQSHHLNVNETVINEELKPKQQTTKLGFQGVASKGDEYSHRLMNVKLMHSKGSSI